MGLLKSINENYKNVPSDQFFTAESISDLSDKIEEGIDEWINLGFNHVIRTLYDVDDLENTLYSLWVDHPKDKYPIILVNSTEDLENIQMNVFNKLVEEEKFTNWVTLLNIESIEIVDPLVDKEIGIKERFFGSPIKSAKNAIKNVESVIPLLRYLLKKEYNTSNDEYLLDQGNIDSKKLDNWKSRLQKAKMWDDDEQILDIAKVGVRRNHHTVNSNLKKSGIMVLTNKKIVFARRSFSLLGFGLASIIPIIAFVRPANKVIILARILWQYLKIPFQIIKPVLGNMWTYIVAFMLSINFIDFNLFFQSISDVIPSFVGLDFAVSGLNFAIQNPWTIASFGGIFALFRLAIWKIFFRRERLIVLPHDQLNFVSTDGNELIGRWTVKGSSTVRAKEGIQYRMRIISKADDMDSKTLAQQFQVKLLDTYKHIEDEDLVTEEIISA